MRFTKEAKEALKTLIDLGYPRDQAGKAVSSAVAMIPPTAIHDFERIFRAAMTALR